ncbi:hypothetical protein F385_1654 [Pantoea agglomerans 299R]|nr:hypothetical protein F385_1654 [Pantoea agglomerans 299R]
MADVAKPMLIQAFIAKASVKTLNKSVLYWLPRLSASGLSSELSTQSHLKRFLIQHGSGEQLSESGVIFLK